MIYTEYSKITIVNGFSCNLIEFSNTKFNYYIRDSNTEFRSVKFEKRKVNESVIMYAVNHFGFNISRYNIKKLKKNGMFLDECELMNWVEFGGEIPKPKKQDDLDAGVDR